MDKLNRQGRVKFEFVRYTRGSGIEVGRGPTTAFPHMLPVRLFGDEGAPKASLRVDNFSALSGVRSGSCDFVLVSDVLPDAGMAGVMEWMRCLRVGGHLCIYEPDEDEVPLVALKDAVGDHDPLDVLRHEEWPWGGWFAVLRKRDGGGLEYVAQDGPARRACVVRHGGVGDQIQAAAILPALKREGFRVTFMTTEAGRDILDHDPHIDDWFMLDKDQVPNHELPAFWSTVARHYERFVNLNEAVEGTLLAIPGRPQHAWPHALRHKMLDRNYAEIHADLAQVEFRASGIRGFYAADEEIDAARERIAEIRRAMNPGPLVTAGEPVYTILWALSGSSVHKWTPHQDEVIAKIMLRLKRAVVILVGDDACRILEVGWEKEPRVISLSGEITIRETLALAQQVNAVVGPETGVLNAVAYEPDILKVIMLSHSSRENLTKNWVNTVAIEGVAPCYPCHQIHHTSEFCPSDKATGAALCQAGMSADDIYRPIDADYTSWAKVQLLRGAA